MLEAIDLCEEITGNKLTISYSETNRIGDHIWYISDVSKFKNHYPAWNWQYDLKETMTEIYTGIKSRY
jgi:CDP-paratose 2-epimerase